MATTIQFVTALGRCGDHKARYCWRFAATTAMEQSQACDLQT